MAAAAYGSGDAALLRPTALCGVLTPALSLTTSRLCLQFAGEL